MVVSVCYRTLPAFCFKSAAIWDYSKEERSSAESGVWIHLILSSGRTGRKGRAVSILMVMWSCKPDVRRQLLPMTERQNGWEGLLIHLEVKKQDSTPISACLINVDMSWALHLLLRLKITWIKQIKGEISDTNCSEMFNLPCLHSCAPSAGVMQSSSSEMALHPLLEMKQNTRFIL